MCGFAILLELLFIGVCVDITCYNGMLSVSCDKERRLRTYVVDILGARVCACVSSVRISYYR
jgi:hypothetical protein